MVNPNRITETDVRIFLQDKPELNPLLRGVRWSAEDIQAAMINVIDFFNTAPPPSISGYTIETFPHRYLMLMGVAGYLLKSAAINQASNNLSYSVDGVTVNDMDKAQIFSELGAGYWNDFKDLAFNIKSAQNLVACYGTMHSEFNYIAR